jgi:hypothetical protein
MTNGHLRSVYAIVVAGALYQPYNLNSRNIWGHYSREIFLHTVRGTTLETSNVFQEYILE